MLTIADQNYWMERAVQLAVDSVNSGGGPFGAIIILNGTPVGEGQNRVTLINDPTAHAEVQAIREACARLGRYHLNGAWLFASCEPCPMCLAASYWAHIERISFSASRVDAAAAGFDDERLYREISLAADQREIMTRPLLPGIAKKPFLAWQNFQNRKHY